MHWNQYVYEAQMNANRLRQERLALNRLQTNQATDKIRDRLRNNPERADIYRGDAMKCVFDEINDPRIYAKALQSGQVKIGGETIRNIPFQYASAAITVSIHQLVNGGPPRPSWLPNSSRPIAKPSRNWARRSGSRSRRTRPPTRRRSGNCCPAINQAEAKADKLLPRNSKDRVEADKYLKALHGLVAMLDTRGGPATCAAWRAAQRLLDSTARATVDLRFGPATTPKQKEVYDSLYPKLVDLRNQIAPALAAASAAAAGGQRLAPGNSYCG